MPLIDYRDKFHVKEEKNCQVAIVTANQFYGLNTHLMYFFLYLTISIPDHKFAYCTKQCLHIIYICLVVDRIKSSSEVLM